MPSSLVFICGFFLLLITAVAVGASEGLRKLKRRIEVLELAQSSHPALPRERETSPLAGLHVALDLRQDHPNAPFAVLLRERILAEDAVISPFPFGGEGAGGEEIAISGEIVCNGYADVYFRADLVCRTADETLITLTEKPPHGDRQENLAREVVARLKAEMAKAERRNALRELS